MLRGGQVAASIDALLLGVDLGRVGFLTQVGVDDLRSALDAIHAGVAEVDERLTLTMRASRPLAIPTEFESLWQYGRGPALPPPAVRPGLADEVGWGVPVDVVAENDVVVEKLARDRQASLAIYMSGRLFASYSADAVIVATPTGSTAYSFPPAAPCSPRNSTRWSSHRSQPTWSSTAASCWPLTKPSAFGCWSVPHALPSTSMANCAAYSTPVTGSGCSPDQNAPGAFN